ncbi:MAG: hypothetical protein JWQ11_1163 [Rhizobacter sp.]|nr:hypothetical protein [Rhizobacter sp.]
MPSAALVPTTAASLLGAWARWRDQRTLKKRPIPDDLWALTLGRFHFLASLSDHDARRLREMATLFLARKRFDGAQGFVVTDEVAVAIAAQACLPVLDLGLHWYDGFVGLVIHADQVVARREEMDADGLVHVYDEVLSGEAMEGGPVMLSWTDVAASGVDGEHGDQAYNVVIHEFAHVIDMRNGAADGVPLLPDAKAVRDWLAVLVPAYEAFCDEVDNGIDTIIDPYGAQGIEEFFATASEALFVAPADLSVEWPQVHALLSRFYKGELTGRP